MPENKLCKYARTKSRRPVGVVVAVKVGDEVHIGWSKCRMAKDEFSRTIGRSIALGRAIASSKKELKDPCPHSLRHDVDALSTRAQKYFKVPVHACEIAPPPTPVEKIAEAIDVDSIEIE